MIIRTVDPSKIVTDTLLISQLEKQGIYQDEVEFSQDYAIPAVKNGEREKGKSPYAKFYKHLNSRSQFMVSNGLPMCDYQGQLLVPEWYADTGGYRSKINQFDGFVTLDGQVTTGCRNDQPDGRKTGQIARWSPILYLNGKQVKAGKVRLLDIDPVNPNYIRNTLEWDYGICKRRIRLIEGHTLGTWEFPTNPNGEVKIVYNQTGDFLVKLGMYAVDKNTEYIPKSVFDSAQYPFEVGDSQTFYPDADAETSSVDGYATHVQSLSWANLITAAGTTATDNGANGYACRINSGASTWSVLYRGILLFDTSGLDDAAIKSGAVLSLYASGRSDNLSVTPNVNIYSSAPASNTAVVAGDFDSLGSTAFCDTAITYANWSNGYKDFTLNASGLAAIPIDSIAKFGTRNANYDVAATEPAFTANKYSHLLCYFAEQGAGYKPKLVVTYTVPTTATITLSAASSVLANNARLNGNITDTGGDDPTVTMYWGNEDGEQTAGNWDNNSEADSPAQPQGIAAFYEDVSSLTSSTTYYFSAKAVNDQGTSWPAASLNFKTASKIAKIMGIALSDVVYFR